MEIYVGTYQGSVIVLETNLQEIKLVNQLSISQNSIKSICILNSQYLIAGGYDEQLKIIDMDSYTKKLQQKCNKGKITVISKINNKQFVIGIDDGRIILWDINSMKIIKQTRYHKKYINNILVVKNGKLMISSAGNKIIIWNTNKIQKIYEYKLNNNQNADIDILKISYDIQWIFYTIKSRQLWKINTNDNTNLFVVNLPISRKIQDFTIFKEFVIVGNDTGQVMAWRFQEQGQLQEQVGNGQLKYDYRIWFKAHNSRIKSMSIVMNEYLLVATAAGEVSIWDFPQFLSTVEKISQNYHLEGLKPLCSIEIKGRILCVDTMIKDVNKNKKQEKHQQQEVKQKYKKSKEQFIQQKNKQKIAKNKLKNQQNKQKQVIQNEKTVQTNDKNIKKTKAIKKTQKIK